MNFPTYIDKYFDNHDQNKIVQVSDRVFGINSRVKEQLQDAKNKTQRLLIVSGLSGAGKDSVLQGLIKKDERFGLIRTCTTRARRTEETIENDQYLRLTEEEIFEADKKGDVIESVEYAGSRYCSLFSVFEDAFQKYEIPILRIDPLGARFYEKLWREKQRPMENVNVIYIFIVPPSIEELRERILERSKDEDLVIRRMAQADIDLPYISEAEYVAINETGKLELVVDEIYKLLK